MAIKPGAIKQKPPPVPFSAGFDPLETGRLFGPSGLDETRRVSDGIVEGSARRHAACVFHDGELSGSRGTDAGHSRVRFVCVADIGRYAP